ncbi:hypothetical protein [Leifsonia sp. 71-9]|uniref:hypothetical protein n=1 Tax=Leifsonia sp. 71-9 TaxID=1895934 RepID=UPI0009263E0C|nr:hypothetical protein [Leifsonia sp. 71-9]OJX74106.1 MAG: hypothetical protein BGO91_17985 [Leifsonia sp. 71-9]
MLHVSMVGHAFAEVDATLITIDDAALVCWSAAGEEPVARYGLEQVLSVQLVQPLVAEPEPASSRSSPEHPNAFRRWTPEQEAAVVDAYRRGETFDQIAAAAGRRVGGVRARLIALGVIEPDPTDRLRFPVSAPDRGAAAPGGAETVREAG